MKRLFLFTIMLLFSAVVVFGQEKYKQGLAAMQKRQYQQAISYFNQQKREPNVSAKTIKDCQTQIAECERQIKLKREQEQREQARREQEAIEAKQRRVVNEQGILYVYFPNGKSDLWADQKRDIKSYVETIGALHKDVRLEITTIIGKAGERLAHQRTDAVLNVIKSCNGNYKINEKNLGGTINDTDNDVVVIIASWPSTGYENGHEWVDLGLSVKWATCNVGASSPGDYGSYFAWGETSSKSSYSWSNYRWCNGSYDNLTRYNTDSSYGTVDNVNLLNSWDDAARANWGGSWRMPTKSEFEELLKNCTRSWTTQGGYRFTSKKNGNSIFLPAAGHRYGAEFNFVGSYGYYWSSSLNSDNPNNAWGLNFGSTSGSMSSSSRLNGFSVRPVTE